MLAQRAALAACVMACACGVGGVDGGGSSGADASPPLDDGGNPIDNSGVTIEFVYLDADGEPAGGDEPIELDGCTIESATLQLHELQLIGDTAPAGDLVVDSRAVAYPRQDEARVSYSAAPPGLYSRFNFDVERAWANEALPDGFDEERLSIRVVGEAVLPGTDRPFDYSDDQKISIDLDFSEEATPGVHRTIIVEIDLAQWFDNVDWAEMSEGQGGGNDPILIGMGSEDAAAQALRDSVAGSFQIRE